MAKKLIETYKAPLTAAQWLTSNLDMHNMTNVAAECRLNADLCLEEGVAEHSIGVLPSTFGNFWC